MKVKKVLISKEWLTGILKGGLSGEYISNAPQDLEVLQIVDENPHVFALYVRSELFDNISSPAAEFPLLEICFKKVSDGK